MLDKFFDNIREQHPTRLLADQPGIEQKTYSEEEVLEIIRQYAFEEHLITSSKPDIWFEQFKKK
jgi:hypothetical protein